MRDETLFHQALERLPHEREAFLRQACGSNDTLRQRVETLLAAHERPAGFMQQACLLPADNSHTAELEFLAPPARSGSLGRLGHYEILEVVGSGGFGVVYKAFDEQLHRVVAVKILSRSLAASATARKRFEREAIAAAAVNHENIVDIHAVDCTGPAPFLVMEYVAGISLEEQLKQHGPLSTKEGVRIGLQIADGLAAAHKQGLVHRDVKPANILLENGVQRVKITDFGLARLVDDASLTQSGLIAGTPSYMSPEQAHGEGVDHRSDLFSLGSVLYAMCTGRAPFRASGTVAVLKRVCDETPTPVSQINSAIPTWLSAIIEKLHAKDPAERYQSAAEVAEVLGRHLAHVQHPSVMPLPQAVAAATEPDSARQVRRSNWRGASVGTWWTVAGVLLLLLFGGLSLTEATGVTRLVPTVIRVWTPEGTLVVEMEDDPAIKVTIEGNGGLVVITGADPHEVRLKPESYKLQAERNGQKIPLERELVSITKGGREIVRVKLESPPAPVVAKTEQGAFVLLAAGQERKFDTLAEAVESTTDGDTIEICGNGPFLTQPIVIRQALTIRAGDGFRPVVRITPGLPGDDWLIAAYASLVLEGLDIREVSKARSQPAWNGSCIIYSDEKSLYLANCRVLQEEPIHEAVVLIMTPSIVILRNCEFHPPGPAIAAFGNDVPLRFVMDNCLALGNGSVTYLNYSHASNEASVEFRRNTFVTRLVADMGITVAPVPPPAGAEEKRVRFEASANVFDIQAGMLLFDALEPFRPKPEGQEAEHVEAVFTPLVGWREKHNLYSPGATSIYWRRERDFLPIAPGNLKDWQRRWNLTDTGSFEGTIRFQGGNLLSRAATALEKLTPDDFRLRPDSAGYRAGKDGEDVGADVDLVGPGPAYERWKKTPEYKRWLKETGQQK